jgi:hypothetical protein
MGLSEIPAKKAFLREKFPAACTSYNDTRSLFASLGPNSHQGPVPANKQYAVIIDGSVLFEPAIAGITPKAIIDAEKKNEDPALQVATSIFGLASSIIGTGANVSAVVLILGDTHERLEIKESRGGVKSTEAFTQPFPIGSEKEIKRHMDWLVGKSQQKKQKPPTAMKKRRLGDDSDDEEPQEEEEDSRAVAQKEELAEFKARKFDCWDTGKEVPANRFKVYRAVTKHLLALAKDALSRVTQESGTVLILDNVVLEKDEYVTMKIARDGTASFLPNTGLCECDQRMIYWIPQLQKTEGLSRFVLDTTDTDMFAYATLNWPEIIKNSPDPVQSGMILFKMKSLSAAEKALGRVHAFDLANIMTLANDPMEWGFLTFVVLGNDFVSKNEVHGLYQITKSGADGAARTANLLETLLSRRASAPRPIVTFDQVKDSRYTDGFERRITFDIDSFVALMETYRAKDALPKRKKAFAAKFNPATLKRIHETCKNAVYAGEYFLNQWRLKENAGTMFKDPASNKDKYDYQRDPSTRKLINKAPVKKERKKKDESLREAPMFGAPKKTTDAKKTKRDKMQLWKKP